MDKSKEKARQIKDLLSVCLAKAIDKALVEKVGTDWFKQFMQEDQEKEPKFQITKNGQGSIKDFDIQALLKFLRYSEKWAQRVFKYYNIYDANDEYASKTQMRQIRSLLDRLISDFRNQMEAHNRVADIEMELEDKPVERIYGYNEASQDMIKLASLFKTVCDKNDVSYYSKMCKINQQKSFLSIKAVLIIVAVVGIIFFVGKIIIQGQNKYHNISNSRIVDGDFEIKPKEIYYDGEEIVVVCYLLNGLDSSVYNVNVSECRLYNEDGVVASARIGILATGEIKPNSYKECKFRLPANTIYVEDVNLRKIEMDCTFKYSKE